MSFNWDNIKYLFQIPLSWFKSIHDRVFGMYGTNFILVKADENGATQIKVDEDSFIQAVKSIATGSVTSVDDVSPDQNGNVQLGAIRTINDDGPDQDGNIDIDFVKSVNSETPDSNGDVEIDVGVLTVNNTSPDQNGNVNVSVDTSDCLKQSDWMNVNATYSVCPYYYANTAYTGNLPAAVTALFGYCGMTQYQTLDDCIEALGYEKASDLGDLAYLDNITVDGHTSDANGAVSFGLTASKWVKTDASGHLTTTNDTPIAIDTSQYTPQDVTSKKVVTGVSWDGTYLKFSSENWTFKNGVLVGRTSNQDQTIDTPVAY